MRVIARELNEAGILTGEGNLWQAAGVLRVLRNEKYCGDLVQKKTYTPDYLTHARKVNRGQEEFVILRDHHAAIIPRELFEEANRLLDVRSTQSQGKGKYSGRHPFSGKIRCGLCGSMYAARFRTRADGKQYRAWRCLQGVKYGLAGCPAGSLRDETVAEIVEKVCGGLGLEKLDVEELLRLVGAEVGTERLAGLRQAGERACQELPEAFTARLVEQIVVTERQAEVRIKGLPYRWSFEI